MSNCRTVVKGKMQCKRCKLWKLLKFFYGKRYKSPNCIECIKEIETENYFKKREDPLFMKMERARRMERYYRQQFENLKKLYHEN